VAAGAAGAGLLAAIVAGIATIFGRKK
jgi:hypothetical protein